MAQVQKLQNIDYLTFDEIADKILSRLLRESEGSNRVDVVFDLYRDIPIKLAERELRGVSDAIKNLAAGVKVKQVKNCFYAMVTTNQVLSDLLWNTGKQHRKKVKDKELHETSENRCYKITAESVEEEEGLKSEEEEADTRLLPHVQQAAGEQRFRSIVVSSEETDVRILCLTFSFSIDVPIFQRRV